MSYVSRAFGILALAGLAACTFEPEQAAQDKVLKEVLSSQDPLAKVGKYLPINENGTEVGVLRISTITQRNSEICAEYYVATLGSNRNTRLIAQDMHTRCLSDMTL